MNRIYILIVPILSTLLITASCKKGKENIDFEESYFGMIPGRFVVYDVMDIYHDKVAFGSDTMRYQMKTWIGDTVIDNEGRVGRKYFRAFRSNSNEDFVAQDVWVALIDNYRAELVEENQRKIKLVFKPTEDKKWDANAFNTLGAAPAEYGFIGSPYYINGLTFPTSLQVKYKDELNQIQINKKFEIYAKEVGLIYFVDKNFSLTIDPSTPSPDTLLYNVGYEKHWKVKTFGML